MDSIRIKNYVYSFDNKTHTQTQTHKHKGKKETTTQNTINVHLAKMYQILSWKCATGTGDWFWLNYHIKTKEQEIETHVTMNTRWTALAEWESERVVWEGRTNVIE